MFYGIFWTAYMNVFLILTLIQSFMSKALLKPNKDNAMKFHMYQKNPLFLLLLVSFVLGPPSLAYSDLWWSSERIENEIVISTGAKYQRILYQSTENKPVRAHIINVTGIGSEYLLGVLGSYGVLFTPSDYAERSEAVALINGGFFSANPNRALGMIAAHGKVLYPPSSSKLLGTVGFSIKTLLFDRITADEIEENQILSEKPGWNECYAAIGAGPLLLHCGKICVRDASASFNLTHKAPRTAIGKKKDGTALLLVVDGRQPDWSAGITLKELATLFEFLGAQDALNLDGGGSSTMIINQQIVNRPSDESLPGMPGKERPVANVIAILKK